MKWLEPIGARIVPANYGPMRDFNAHARIDGTCGDTMEFWLELDGETIQRASFTTDGCETSMACGGAAAHLSHGKDLAAMRRVRPIDVLETLEQPDNEEAHHCADLALRTMGQALDDYERSLHQAEDSCDNCKGGCCEECEEDCAERAPAKKDAMDLGTGAGGIQKRILVLSGKGGVGKSTVAVNLAMGFAFEGLRTGILDVDIHGPSVPKLLGLERERLRMEGQDLLPVPMGGLKVLSLGFALKPDEAAIWRGPMKAGVVEQFVKQAQWGELDVLVVDCPPGTGDEHLSILQALGRVDGAVIVTTPQDLAVLDARKAITFCRTAGIPILGLVENMSGFHCPSCGTMTPIFRADGGRHLAKELKIPFLGALPIDPDVGEAGDAGQPRLYRELGFGARKAFQPVLQRLMKVVEVPVP
jgi:ATP-binding protein involved in chromosome partitioning